MSFVLKLIDRGISLPLGSVDNRRRLISLWNLCDLLERCITHPQAAGETFLAADGEDLSTPMLLLAAVAGFLFWNFPKARIFMGDAGSGFIGMTLGVLSIQAAWVAPALFWGWVILLGAFVVDATVTLVRRVRRGERFYQAHRSHAYQYAARRYGAHPPVSLAFGAINVFWLLPVAALVAVGWLDGVLGVIIAYAPPIWLAVRFKAGARELQEV